MLSWNRLTGPVLDTVTAMTQLTYVRPGEGCGGSVGNQQGRRGPGDPGLVACKCVGAGVDAEDVVVDASVCTEGEGVVS